MEIKPSNSSTVIEKNQTSAKSTQQPDVSFADELKDLNKTEKDTTKEVQETEEKNKQTETLETGSVESTKNNKQTETLEIDHVEFPGNTNPPDEKAEVKLIKNPLENPPENNIVNALGNLNDTLSELNSTEPNQNINSLQSLNHAEDNEGFLTKDIKINVDINLGNKNNKISENDTEKDNEGDDLINNDFNIDNKDKLPQMMPNMNFGGDGQPFSSFMQNNENANQNNTKLSSSAKDLAEEAAILSTMAENIAIANSINVKADSIENDEKIISKEDGIKKIDTKTHIIKEVIVKYDTVVMNEADVEVFTNLVEGKEININNLTPETVNKSVQVSKTLSDMLAKAMEDNRPVRIEFDNGISVIIKISKDGKLSADFLPSTQIAEAYLRENLPLLKQKFSEQGLDYDQLNQRERRNPDREQNKKKGRDNE